VHRYAICILLCMVRSYETQGEAAAADQMSCCPLLATISVFVQCPKFSFVKYNFTALLNAEFSLTMIISLISHPINNVQ